LLVYDVSSVTPVNGFYVSWHSIRGKVFLGWFTMEVKDLNSALEPIFWKKVNQDVYHYHFFAFDWKYHKEKTRILLTLEGTQINGMMLVFDGRIAQLRGKREVAEILLANLDLVTVELQSPLSYKEQVLRKYNPTISHEMILMLLNKGELDGVRLLSPKTVELMTQNHLTNGVSSGWLQHLGFGLGFFVEPEPGVMGEIGSKGTYGWSGGANTRFWIDPEEELITVFLVQTFGSPYPPADTFKNLAYQAIIR